MKMSCWFTWEAIANIVKRKDILLMPHKVAAHSGDINNNQADLAAMEAREQRETTYFCNSDSSRITFALAHRQNLVEENPRKFLKHLTQNICRANWTTHHMSDLVVKTARTYEVDWHTTRHILHPDGKIKSGFSSTKTSTLRTYLVKSITNTLLTMSTLNRKWAMYDTSACSRCDERNKTNEHI